jgi:hypothetical protein
MTLITNKSSKEMCFPTNHPEFPGQPKRMYHALTEQGLWKNGLVMQCKKSKDGSGGKFKPGATNCCAKCILDLWPDFQEQKSLVQEVIKAAGHLCIFLPKFHCKLNFIEFFWGVVKRYLHENCN